MQRMFCTAATGQPFLPTMRQGGQWGTVMTKSGWSVIVLLVAMALWTLLAWGASGILGWLPALTGLAQSGSAQLAPQLTGLLNLVPQTLLDSGLPWLQQLGNWLAGSFPLLLTWAGYVVWLIWGLGMLALLVLGALVRRVLISDSPDRLPPRA
jgi:hypothetical protein